MGRRCAGRQSRAARGSHLLRWPEILAYLDYGDSSRISNRSTRFASTRGILGCAVLFLLGMALPMAEAGLVQDERTGLYYDPEVEVTLGTEAGQRLTGRIIGITLGKLEVRLETGRVVDVPLYELDAPSREYLRSLEPRFEVRTGTLKLPTPFERPPIMEVNYQYALRDGQMAAEAVDMVYHAPFYNESDFFAKAHHRHLTEEYGLTVFTFRIPTTTIELADPAKAYPSIESGWPRFIFTVQKALMDELRLPWRKLLVTGESAGARMAANMALEYPQWVDAVAFVGGGSFDPVPTEGSSPLWCILQTVEDNATTDNEQLMKELRQSGSYAVYGRFPPIWENRKISRNFYHSPNDTALMTMADFIGGVAEQRRKNEEWPNPQSWRHGAESSDESLPRFPSEDTGYSSWKSRLPSEAFAERGKKRLLPLVDASFEWRGGYHPFLLGIPTSGKPGAIVLYAPSREKGSIDPLYWLMSRNLLVGGLELPEDRSKGPEVVAAALEELHRIAADLPVYVIADEGSAGAVAQGIAAGPIPVTELIVAVTRGLTLRDRRTLPPPPTVVSAVDGRQEAAKKTLPSDHPFYRTGWDDARRLVVGGESDPEEGERWLALWTAIADLCR